MVTIKILFRLLLIGMLLNLPNYIYAFNTEKELCEKFKVKFEDKSKQMKIAFNDGKSSAKIRTESLDIMMEDINGVLKQTAPYKGIPLINGNTTDQNFINFLAWVNQEGEYIKKNAKSPDNIPPKKDSSSIHIEKSTEPADKKLDDKIAEMAINIESLKNDINNKPFLGFDWQQIGFIALWSFLMGLLGILAYSQISKLNNKIKDLEDKMTFILSSKSGTSTTTSSPFNEDIYTLKRSLQDNSTDISNLKTQIQQLKKSQYFIENSSFEGTKSESLSNIPLSLLYISCLGNVEGNLLTVSLKRDNNSIFQINTNTNELTVMDVEDKSLYEVVIRSISIFWGILKHTTQPKDQDKKIITIKPGRVKKLTDTQWQIEDNHLMEVKFE
jgi:outer membrane lipoprotein-sorting protein